MPETVGLRQSEIYLLVSEYLGGTGGYLYGFSYSTHDEFYAQYCDLDVDTAAYRNKYGTTRRAFIGVLKESPPDAQARIIDGVLAKFPISAFREEERESKQGTRDKLISIAARLRGGPAVEVDNLRVRSAAVARAISDAATLIRDRGATSGVDRIHTALHGYLIALVRRYQIQVTSEPSITDLLKALRQNVRELQDAGPRSDDVASVLRAVGSIIGALNPIRNQASGAHPNDEVLAEPEAFLVIDAAHTILNYLNRKLHVD